MEAPNNPPTPEVEQPDFRILPLVYSLPGMYEITRQRDLVYKTLKDGTELAMDVYYPDSYDGQALLPAVLFVHGDAPPEILKDAKDWACYIGWGELLAASGLAAVTFNHRSTEMLQKIHESAADVDDLIRYVRTHSRDLGIDPERLAIWTCSAGSYRGLRAALRGSPSYIRCAASYYGVIDPKAFFAGSVSDEQETSVSQPDEKTLAEFSVATYIRQNSSLPPLLFARAGLDDPDLNAGLDELVRVMLERNCSFDLLNHATGDHGFDTMNDNERSREIMRATLAFFRAHLVATEEGENTTHPR